MNTLVNECGRQTHNSNVISDKIEQRTFHYGNPEKEVMNTSFSSPILSSALISTNCSALPDFYNLILFNPHKCMWFYFLSTFIN